MYTQIFYALLHLILLYYQWQFGEGTTPPPPGYTGYDQPYQQQTEEQQIKNEDLSSSSSRHAQDIYSPERPTADVMPESSSSLIRNIPDDD